MQPIVVNEGPPPWLRWLALPAAILVIVVVALALDSESRESYVDRVRVERAQEVEFEDINATRLYLTTEDGKVVEFSVGENGEGSLGRDADGKIQSLSFIEDEDGDFAGLIVNDDGTFTPYAHGDDIEGKTTLSPNGSGGFSLKRSDGSRIDVVVDSDGLHAVDADGNVVNLDRNGDGHLDLGDGLTAGESDVEFELEDGQASPSSSRDQGGSGGGFGGLGGRTLLIIILGLLAIAGAAWWFIAMKPKFRLQEAAVPAAVGVPVVAGHIRTGTSSASGWDRFEEYLVELLADPEPERAVRLAFAYAEQGVGVLPAREIKETPAEWCARVQEASPDIAQLLQPLANSYSAIRFGDQSVTSAERDGAVDELRQLVYGACK